MGSCVSVHKDPNSAVKLRFSIGSKNEKLMIPSPVKQKPDTVNGGDCTVADVSLKRSPPGFRDAGSKDEAFFDSQPWLESDCEDDYYSVNGEFTPSRGSTPVHHSFSSGNRSTSNVPPAEQKTTSEPEPSPSDKKKRLSELFKESLHSDHVYVVEETPTKALSEAKLANVTPYLSGANSGNSSERTLNGVLRTEDKSSKSAQCCLPGLRTSRSFSEKKRKTSPSQSVG